MRILFSRKKKLFLSVACRGGEGFEESVEVREGVGAAGLVDDDSVYFGLEEFAFGFEASFGVGEGFGTDFMDARFDLFEVVTGLPLEGGEVGMVLPRNIDQHFFGHERAEVKIASDGEDLKVR